MFTGIVNKKGTKKTQIHKIFCEYGWYGSFTIARAIFIWDYISVTWRIDKPFYLLLIGHFFLSCQWQWITPLLLTRIWRRDSAACVFPRGFLPVFGFYTFVNILNFKLVRRGLFDFIRYVFLYFTISWLLEIGYICRYTDKRHGLITGE